MTDPSSWDWSRVIFDQVHLRVADLNRSRTFYLAALKPLGIPLMLDTPELIAFANLALSADKAPTTGAHVCFTVGSRDEVEAFHARRSPLVAPTTEHPAPWLRPLRRLPPRP